MTDYEASGGQRDSSSWSTSGDPPSLRNVYIVLKLVGTAVGFVLSMASLYALLGTVVQMGIVRWALALVLTLAVPFLAVDRVLRIERFISNRAVGTDVLAMVLMLQGAVLTLGLESLTRPAMIVEADRRYARGAGLSGFFYALAAVHPVDLPAPLPELPPIPSAPAAASGSVGLSAAEPTGAAAASASAPSPPVEGSAPFQSVLKDLLPLVGTVWSDEGGPTRAVASALRLKGGVAVTSLSALGHAGRIWVQWNSEARTVVESAVAVSKEDDLLLFSAAGQDGARLAAKDTKSPDAVLVLSNPVGLEATLDMSRHLKTEPARLSSEGKSKPPMLGSTVADERGIVFGMVVKSSGDEIAIAMASALEALLQRERRPEPLSEVLR